MVAEFVPADSARPAGEPQRGARLARRLAVPAVLVRLAERATLPRPVR
jgi:hypothetical protein